MIAILHDLKFILKEALKCLPYFSSFKYKCVYWNYTKSSWNSNGCSYTLRNDSLHQCDCNHLTSFAILMSIGSSSFKCKICEKILEYATYIGNFLSIFGLVMTITVYLKDYIK